MQRDIVAVHPEDDVERLLRLMRERDLPGVPVIDHSDRLVGIVTEADLVIRDQEADLRLPHHIDLLGGVIFLEPIKHYEQRLRQAFASTVSEMMTRDPITVAPDDTVRHAARLIATHRHNRLPVVDEDGTLVGVLTRVDVLESLTR
ncbi:MAG TPA: CBS domain-containing protein [Solirubrobacteraceae bacterium]|nr:CBS domain-containing protein [Solirubrobacteraceae bacterium]